MRALVQRVSEARVRVGGETGDIIGDNIVGEIGPGLCVFVGVTHTDTEQHAAQMARRLAGLRLFPDAAGVMNVSVTDAGGAVLVVSQFTLYGDTSRGRRPSWSAAAAAAYAEPLVAAVADGLRRLGLTVATGRFGAAMQVELVNDGPVTVLVET